MDTLDRKILMLLKNDSQTPLAELSAEVGLSTTALHHRIKKLKESGIIQRFTIDIDRKKIDENLICFVRIVKNKRSSIEIAQKFKTISQIESCYSVTGEESITVKIRFANTRELQEILEKIQKVEGVEKTLTSFVIEEHFDRGVSLIAK